MNAKITNPPDKNKGFTPLFRSETSFFFISGKCIPDWRVKLLAGSDCVGGTNLSAASAVDAGIRIDVIDFTFADCLYGANGLTSTACYAVVTNYICHNLFLFYSGRIQAPKDLNPFRNGL